MLRAVAAIALSFLALEDPAPVVDPERLKVALSELQQAFDKGTDEQRVEAMRRHGTLADAEVVDWVERGLSSKTPQVRDTAVETLRFLEHPAALAALERGYDRLGGRLRDDDLPAYAALIKAIGQHGNPSSIGTLVDDIWEVPDHAVFQARVFSLGRVRSGKSVEALLGVMKSGGRDRIQPFMGDLRVPLTVLTGVDQGESQDMWMAWWNDNKHTLEVGPELPPLPKPMAVRWASYWGDDPVGERGPKRGDRGRE